MIWGLEFQVEGSGCQGKGSLFLAQKAGGGGRSDLEPQRPNPSINLGGSLN